MTERIPVTLLTGFLGSGKTTLLARLLRSAALSDAAVIVNEFGDVGLDHLLIEKGEEDVVLLDSGCLCCTASSGLAETLEDLYYRRLRGTIPRFTRVVVETSGLAEPGPILHILLADPTLTRWYVLDGVVTTVDGLLGGQQLETHAVSRKQAATADVLVLTKMDVCEPQELARLEEKLARLNPRARRIAATGGDVDAALVVNLGPERSHSRPQDLVRWLKADGPGSLAVPHHHPDDVASHTFLLAPMQWSDYAAWLAALRRLPAERLLRVKGIVALGEDASPHVVQGVQHVFSHPRALNAWPWDDRLSRLVFIVQGLDPETLAGTLAQHDPRVIGGDVLA